LGVSSFELVPSDSGTFKIVSPVFWMARWLAGMQAARQISACHRQVRADALRAEGCRNLSASDFSTAGAGLLVSARLDNFREYLRLFRDLVPGSLQRRRTVLLGQRRLADRFGNTEAGVKQFNKRVKGTEQFWSEDGVEAILCLRGLWLS